MFFSEVFSFVFPVLCFRAIWISTVLSFKGKFFSRAYFIVSLCVRERALATNCTYQNIFLYPPSDKAIVPENRPAIEHLLRQVSLV